MAGRPAPPIRRRRYPDIQTYILKTGDTQARIAAAVGASQAQISRIIHGQMMPRPELALRLARYCRIPLDSFTRRYVERQRGAA